ncbi:DUF6443 domain-containing protein [Sphingobacterium sp. LRF_L2]|uniref:DUF6443 domain-containing protein n=1 Tax=Sphingobacterium sp. LRF_L2 TaxID=3369421 RepID=UPI003F61634E
MKIYIIIVALLVFNLRLDAQISADKNYVMETVVTQKGIKQVATMNRLSVYWANRTIRYYDGIGRPTQEIEWQTSPSGKDIIVHMEYDSLGRLKSRYLPYVDDKTSASYRSAANTAVRTFYSRTTGTDINGIIRSNHPLSLTVFEPNPLGRVAQQGFAGAAWQPLNSQIAGSGHTVKTVYGTNGTDVKLWRVITSGGAETTGAFPTGRLKRTTTMDENWTSGRAGTIDLYTDFEDRVILNRQWYVKPTTGEESALDTYYVYDDFGNLRYVVPAAVTVSSFSENSSDPSFRDYIYSYRYDERQRLIEKKIPGKGRELIIYNRNDLPVLKQDSVQRLTGKWSYIKYDGLHRPISTGLYTNTAQKSYSEVRTLVEAVATLWEERIATAEYTNLAFPSTVNQIQELTSDFYDDYTFTGASGLPKKDISESQMVRGRLTGRRVFREDGSAPLLTVNFYDNEGRLIQQASQNHIGGTDYQTNTYNFTGELITSKREHKPSATGAVSTVLLTRSYDHAGRPIDTKIKVNSQQEVLQSRLLYNEIGQLKQKKLHSENGGLSFLTAMDYSYNERNWGTRIISPHFSQALSYENGRGVASPQYNGNISTMDWWFNENKVYTWKYGYDIVNRLISASADLLDIDEGEVYYDVMRELPEYDVMGNITKLARDGGTPISYTYTGNRLMGLSGGLSGTYTYDPNGNATRDRTGMTFTYSHLNLPRTATKTGVNVAYLYDAVGTKLRKTATVGTILTQRDYIGGIEYSKTGTGSSTIDMILTEEGYLQNSSGTYSYHYNLKDHLGNVRAVIKRGTASATTVDIVQQQDYYPFGKTRSIVTGGNNKYLYNGKEVQTELGDQLDYGARFYDPEIGRWNVVDPLAEQMRRHSPYNYTFNNPIRFIDPDGRGPNDFVQRNDGSIYWDNNANDQASTKSEETYLGKTLKFEFNSYIDGKLWDGPTMGGLIDPAGDKLTSTVTLRASENENGELTGLSASKSVKVGDTPFGEARGYYPGEGGSNNVLTKSTTAQGTNINFEQHASVSKLEEISLNAIGFKIVDVAQKLNISYNNSNGNLSVTASTNVFPSATLKVNGGIIMRYNQPSFPGTHAAPFIGSSSPSSGSLPIRDFSYYPSKFYRR